MFKPLKGPILDIRHFTHFSSKAEPRLRLTRFPHLSNTKSNTASDTHLVQNTTTSNPILDANTTNTPDPQSRAIFVVQSSFENKTSLETTSDNEEKLYHANDILLNEEKPLIKIDSPEAQSEEFISQKMSIFEHFPPVPLSENEQPGIKENSSEIEKMVFGDMSRQSTSEKPISIIDETHTNDELAFKSSNSESASNKTNTENIISQKKEQNITLDDYNENDVDYIDGEQFSASSKVTTIVLAEPPILGFDEHNDVEIILNNGPAVKENLPSFKKTNTSSDVKIISNITAAFSETFESTTIGNVLGKIDSEKEELYELTPPSLTLQPPLLASSSIDSLSETKKAAAEKSFNTSSKL